MSTEVNNNTFNNSSNTVSTGKEGCKCTNMTDVLASLKDRTCQLPDGNSGVQMSVSGQCVPYSYGSGSCLPHDMWYDRRCMKISSGVEEVDSTITINNDIPEYCSRTWCYVDKSCARLSEEQLVRSEYFLTDDIALNAYYSYSTCDSNSADWDTFSVAANENPLKGKTLVAAIPGYWEPFHYKRGFKDNVKNAILDAPGIEFYNDSIHFEGATIKYMDALTSVAGGDFNVTYTHVSKYARKAHPGSWYTAVVQDVKDGLVDIGVGPFWVTGERLQMTPFTVPADYDRTYLVIPKPGSQITLQDQVFKVIEPFATGVWVMLLLIIASTAFLLVWFSGKTTKGRKGRKRVYARWALDSFLQTGVYFCSHGVEMDKESSLPTKLLMFGFAFFVLIVVSAYVANLAAFLTRNSSGYDGTIEAAILSGQRICALPALKAELEARWDKAIFVYEQEGSYTKMLTDLYDQGKCDVLAVGDIDMVSNLQIANELCKRNLVATTSLIIENAIAFPINPSLASGLSYWMYKGEKYHGVSHMESMKKYNEFYNRVATCNVQFDFVSDGADEFARITVENLFFPMIFFVGFAFFAILLQLYFVWSQRRNEQQRHFIGRLSTIGAPPEHMQEGTAEEHSSQAGDDEQPKDQQLASTEEGFSNPSPHQDGDEVYSKFQQLVDTGAMDDFFACFQALKHKEE